MNPLDMVVIVVVGYCLIRGLFRGLVKELSSIVGVLGGFYAAYTYYPLLVEPLASWITSTTYNNLLSFLIIFICVFIIISLLGVLIKFIMKVVFLGWLDRVCGAGFGTIKGILITSVLVLALTTFLPKGAGIVKNSLLAPHITLISERLSKIVSKEMKGEYRLKLKELKKIWKI
jgi:membrane protein required for colicin V production